MWVYVTPAHREAEETDGRQDAMLNHRHAAAARPRRHEIVGILSMAFALFALLSLLSMQLGTNQMMGPGGAATAAGLYTLAGLGAYLVIAGLTVAAVRCFRARPLVAGSGRGGGGAAAAGRGRRSCCTCRSRDARRTFHGPGGLLGQ